MWFALLFFLAGDVGSPTLYEGTEIYDGGLSRGSVAVAPDGQLYLANQRDHHIIHFAADGKELRRIGRKGKGPGEFEFLGRIFFQGDKLMGYDLMNDRIHVFTADGTFVEELRTPERALTLAKAEKGWVALSMFSMSPDSPPKVMWFDEKFENKRIVVTLPEAGEDMMHMMADGGKVKFNPARDHTMLAGHPDHRFIYLKHPGDFRISVIDGQTGTVVRTITRQEKKVPFNEAYGNEAIAAMNRTAGDGPISFQYEADFPKYFPVIRTIAVNGNGLLVVEKWTAPPDQSSDLVVLDHQDREADLGYPAQLSGRVVAERGKDIYLLASGDSDEVIVIRCRRNQAATVAEAHPLRLSEDQPGVVLMME